MKRKSYIIAFWSPFSAENSHYCFEFFLEYLCQYADIQFLDCNRNYPKSRIQKLLRQVDLVVICLRQSKKELEDYFCRQIQLFSNVIYLIRDYFSANAMTVSDICTQYRIPVQRLIWIPYNARYLEAIRKGKEKNYLQEQESCGAYEETIRFWKDITRCAKKLLQALELEYYG